MGYIYSKSERTLIDAARNILCSAYKLGQGLDLLRWLDAVFDTEWPPLTGLRSSRTMVWFYWAATCRQDGRRADFLPRASRL